MSTSGIKDKSTRRWFQYRLRSLLIVAVLVNIAASWFATRMASARRQQAAIAAFEEAGGFCEYDYELDEQGRTISPPPDAPGPVWLRNLMGVDFLANVMCVSGNFQLYPADQTLTHLNGVPRIRMLFLDATSVTDTGMAHVAGLKELEYLGLGDTQLTDAGLVHVKGLWSLKHLSLMGTVITDAGLAHLDNLSNLEELYLYDTDITDAGLARLAQLSNLRNRSRASEPF